MVAKGAYRLRHVRPSVSPSFRKYQHGSHWQYVLEIEANVYENLSRNSKLG
jgi:hypothetical protein